jgi:hypothetical protein
MRRILVVLVATSLLMLGLVSPAAAQNGPSESFKFRDSFTGQTADASWFACEPDTPEAGLETCTFTDIWASDGRGQSKDGPGKPTPFSFTAACISMFTVVFTSEGDFVDEEESIFGCDENASLTIAGDLTSATLNANVTLIECEEDPDTGDFFCEEIPNGAVAVSATWTGTGGLIRFMDRHRSMDMSLDHRCAFSFSGRGLRREATATATVDGVQLGDSDWASLSDGSFKSAASCRFR